MESRCSEARHPWRIRGSTYTTRDRRCMRCSLPRPAPCKPKNTQEPRGKMRFQRTRVMATSLCFRSGRFRTGDRSELRYSEASNVMWPESGNGARPRCIFTAPMLPRSISCQQHQRQLHLGGYHCSGQAEGKARRENRRVSPTQPADVLQNGETKRRRARLEFESFLNFACSMFF